MDYIEEIKNNKNLSKMAMIAKKEGKNGKNYKKVMYFTKTLVYAIPKKYCILKEENIADFYLYFEPKIINYLCQFNIDVGDYYKYISTVIYRWASFYRIRCEKQKVKDSYKLNVFCKYLNNEDTYYETIDQSSAYIVKKHYDRVEEESPIYKKFTAYNEIKKIEDNYLRKLFDEIMKNKSTRKNEELLPSTMKSLYQAMEKEKNRKHFLIFLLTIPNAILENYTKEVALLFDEKEEKIIEILTHVRLLCLNDGLKKNSERDKGTKYLMNLFSLNLEINSNRKKISEDEINKKIAYNKRLYNQSLKKQKKINNKHVSQRKLAKALDIKSGTIASSILSAKALLNNCIEVSTIK